VRQAPDSGGGRAASRLSRCTRSSPPNNERIGFGVGGGACSLPMLCIGKHTHSARVTAQLMVGSDAEMERLPVMERTHSMPVQRNNSGGSASGRGHRASLSVGSDTLGKLLTELCYRSPGTAKVGETTLKMHVSAEARDLSGEALTRFMNDLHSRLFKMVNRLSLFIPSRHVGM
jgi:hypothetical protein